MTIELQAAVEVRARIHRSTAAIGGGAAVQQHLAPIVDRRELDPDIERVHGASGKEVPHVAGPHHYLDPYRLAAPDDHRGHIKRCVHFGRGHGDHAPRPEL